MALTQLPGSRHCRHLYYRQPQVIVAHVDSSLRIADDDSRLVQNLTKLFRKIEGSYFRVNVARIVNLTQTINIFFFTKSRNCCPDSVQRRPIGDGFRKIVKYQIGRFWTKVMG